jgi:hypothetical protein
METLDLDITGDEIGDVLDRTGELLAAGEQVDVEAVLVDMLAQLEAAKLGGPLQIEDAPTNEVHEPEAAEEPRTIEEVVNEYENLGFTVFPVGEQAFREAERIVDEAGSSAVIDLERVEAMVLFARNWDRQLQRAGIPDDHRHMFIGRGPLGNRGMVTTADGQQVRNEYLVLVMLQADEQGHIRQRCWADSPVTERNSAFVWDSGVSIQQFPNWERIYAGTKQEARSPEAGARALKHTSPSDKEIHATMMQRVWSLLTGSKTGSPANPPWPREHFYRDTDLL